MATETRRVRATPMSPEQRRAAIIDATLPLVRQHGFDVSTRQIAEAAGIAEGTIFRVFDDKDSLLKQVLEAAIDPGDTERRLRAIGTDLPLEHRLLVAAEILHERLTSVFQLMVAIGFSRPPGDDGRQEPPRHAGIMAVIAALVEPDRRRLRVPPVEVARRLRILAFAGFHPLINDHEPMTPAEVVDLLLHGVVAAPATTNDPSP
ncbi:TetR/AcrR family transcriptional regulator [Jiangella alkaliphila]|uniref:DNA-binding transcriptional regulator, AcrR family n=1 Tax=Jiangella alkaliphila TaxID=419479 RepID=A0A1H2LH07_9ACTN|nr:TetR/AcrR family transcriptional regulator [Jiangella alkaliphila]SDU80320.1 DNA-binding transcriptional regulator, AcrR family [Jiangella alkaliphila]